MIKTSNSLFIVLFDYHHDHVTLQDFLSLIPRTQLEYLLYNLFIWKYVIRSIGQPPLLPFLHTSISPWGRTVGTACPLPISFTTKGSALFLIPCILQIPVLRPILPLHLSSTSSNSVHTAVHWPVEHVERAYLGRFLVSTYFFFIVIFFEILSFGIFFLTALMSLRY